MNITELEARATKRLEAERTARIDSIKSLAENAALVTETRAKLATAEREHTAAYSKALKLGWTDGDLKEFGIETPSRKPSGRPRGTRKPAAPRTSPAQAETPETEHSSSESAE